MKFHEATLDNGLTVIAELNPSVHSVAAGFFVRTGARDESMDVNGVSHFLEHMAFKGNEKHSADDVNRIFDELGARYNASTSEEVTLFYAAVLPEYLADAFEVLSGLMRPSLRDADFEVERKVILEEIGMYEDQPSFIAYENAMKTHFDGHPLGQSILGSSDSISHLKRDEMADYHREHYRAGNITVAVAGNTDWNDVLRLANQWCGKWEAGSTPRKTDEARAKGGKTLTTKEAFTQQHVMQMSPAPSATSPLRMAAELMSVVVGDDSGSRLYWDLVDTGLAESADLSYNEYDGTGAYLTYVCSTPESAGDNLATRPRHLRRRQRQGRHRRGTGAGPQQGRLANRAPQRATHGPLVIAGLQLGLPERIPLRAGRPHRLPRHHHRRRQSGPQKVPAGPTLDRHGRTAQVAVTAIVFVAFVG